MAIETVREINRDWAEVMTDYEYNNTYWLNEPFSDEYWQEKYKIVLCNIEAYGDVEKNDHVLTLDQFGKWLALGSKTVKNSALFVYCLYRKLHGSNVTKEQLHDLYGKNSELLSVVRKTTYMNLRKEENWEVKEDTEEIYRFLAPGWTAFKNEDLSNEPNRKLTLEFIEAIEPDIFIITGRTGQDVLNKIYEGKIELPWQGMCRQRKTLYVSIEHPSRVSYEYIAEKTDEICKNYLG